jgi:hypothetical protein
MATISFCMTTRGPLPRIPALLSLVRPHVDEIVLAVDRTGNLDVLDACRDLADRRLTFDYAAPPCRNIGFLQHECSCDWLLRFDDDEIPSRALLDALPELVADRRPTHYGLTRRWLHGDTGTWVLSPPWHPDYQLRLVRNVPGLWRFTGEMHDGAIVLGERRLADLPIYHADLLLLPADERRRKAERYERLRPDHLAEGVPVNAIYVPEDWEGLATERVPEADRAAIDSVLHGPPAPAPAGPSDRDALPHVTVAEIDRFNTNREVGPGAYRARVAFVRPVDRVAARVVRQQEVLVENLGDEVWPWGPDAQPPIRLGHRWRDARSGDALGEGPRTPFTEAIAPGGRALVNVLVEAPERPGRYVLEVDIVHEHVRWFECGAALEVVVEEPAGGSGGARPGRLRGYLAQARAHGLGTVEALRRYPRWAASLRDGRDPLADARPWMTYAGQELLAEAVGPDSCVCEYGAGGSTLFLLERAGEVVTVESDGAWAERVGAAVADDRRRRWALEVAPPEVDPAGRGTDPADPGGYVSASPAFLGFTFRAYAAAIDRFADEAFDVVVVGGRARPSCLRHALAKVRRGGLLVLDHAERSWYQPALALAGAPDWAREDRAGPGPYAERFWRTAVLRRQR